MDIFTGSGDQSPDIHTRPAVSAEQLAAFKSIYRPLSLLARGLQPEIIDTEAMGLDPTALRITVRDGSGSVEVNAVGGQVHSDILQLGGKLHIFGEHDAPGGIRGTLFLSGFKGSQRLVFFDDGNVYRTRWDNDKELLDKGWLERDAIQGLSPITASLEPGEYAGPDHPISYN